MKLQALRARWEALAPREQVLVLAATALVAFALLGVGTSVGLQARFAATDVASPERRGRDLSLVVWSTTIGAVVGPNLWGPGTVIQNALGLPEHTGSFVIAIVAPLVESATCTLTVTVQLPVAGIVTPDSATEGPFAAAVTVPSAQVVAPPGVAVLVMYGAG